MNTLAYYKHSYIIDVKSFKILGLNRSWETALTPDCIIVELLSYDRAYCVRKSNLVSSASFGRKQFGRQTFGQHSTILSTIAIALSTSHCQPNVCRSNMSEIVI